MSVVNVITRIKNEHNKLIGYATVCIEPHYVCEGIMVTSSLWDATKFPLDSKDAEAFVKYLNENWSDKFELVPIDERHLSATRHEYWEDEYVHGDYPNTHIFRGNNMEVYYG